MKFTKEGKVITIVALVIITLSILNITLIQKYIKTVQTLSYANIK